MVIVTAISGLLLAHSNSVDPRAERPLAVRGSGSIDEAMPINDLLIASLKAIVDWPVRYETPLGNLRRPRGPGAIERALFRPANGTVQVLLRDPLPLEIVLDWKTSQVLSVAPRHEFRWLRVHSAEQVLGEDGTLKRDAIAALVTLMSLTGLWACFRRRPGPDVGRATRMHRTLGVVAAFVVLVPAVTGVLMNHRVDLGFTYRATGELEGEALANMRPARLAALADAGVEALTSMRPGATRAEIDWLSYSPEHASVTVGFKDGTDVFIDAFADETQAVMPPRDSWVRALHSGRIFGPARPLITTALALLLISVTVGGFIAAVDAGRRTRASS